LAASETQQDLSNDGQNAREDDTSSQKSLEFQVQSVPQPANPKIYHIVHVDKLASIAADGCLWSDAKLDSKTVSGTIIGMNHIKQARRIRTLPSLPNLHVGECVPFYFGPRSVMLFMMHAKNAELDYKGGQEPIVHLVADLAAAVAWANANNKKWAFTLSNAASKYFEDRTDFAQISEINWDAVNAQYWSSCREAKQAEFLIEQQFPWNLVEEIAVINQATGQKAVQAIAGTAHRPGVQIRPAWYYEG
jgi:ssDNA thymidine ADP-ribosyltransferase, DarT